MSGTHVHINSVGIIRDTEAIIQCGYNFSKTLSGADRFVACVKPDSGFFPLLEVDRP